MRILRGIAYVLLGIPILLGIVLLVALVYLRTDSGRGRLRAVVIQQVRSSVPGLDFERLGGDLTRTIILEGVRIRDREGREAIAAARITAHFDLLGLFSRTIRVDEIRIEHVRVMAAPGRSGRLNLTELTIPTEKEAGEPWALDLRRLVVYGGAGSFTSETGQKIEVYLAQAKVQLDATKVKATLDRLEVDGVTPAGSLIVFGDAEGPRTEVALDFHILLPGRGRGHLGGHVDLEQLGYAVDVAVDGADPEALRSGLQHGSVNLRLSVRGKGAPGGESSRLDAALHVTPSHVQGIDVRALTARATLEGRNWRLVSLDGDAAGIRASAHGHGGPHAIALEVDAKTAGPMPIEKTRGRVSLHASVSGGLPDRLAIRARASGQNLAFGDQRIAFLTLSADAADVPRRPRGKLHLEARTVVFEKGQAPLDEVALDAVSDGKNVRVRGRGFGGQARGELAMHGRVAARAMDVTIDRLSLRLPHQTAELSQPTTIHLRTGESVAIDPTHIHLAGPKLSGDVAAHGIYRFRATREPRLEAALSVRKGAFPGLDHVDLDAHAAIDRTTARASADLALGLHRTPVHLEATLPVVTSRRSRLPALAEKGPIAVHAVARNVLLRDLPVASLERRGLKGGAIDVEAIVDGRVEHPTLQAEARLRDLCYRDLSGLQATLNVTSSDGHTIVTGDATLRGRPLLDLRGKSELALEHVLARRPLPDLPFEVQVRVPGLDVTELRGLGDALAGYQGVLRASADISGSLAHPRGTAQATIAGGKVDQIALGPVTMTARFDDQMAHADVALVELAGGRLDANATYQRASGALTADLRASHVHVDFARAFLKQMRDFGGVLDADVKVRGTAEAPTLAGRVTVTRGVVGMVGQPTFRDVELYLALSPGHVDIQKIHAISNGRFDAHGSADLRGLQLVQLTLSAKADGFAVAMGGTTGRLDGSFGVQAALREEVLAGRVQIPEATVWLPRIAGGRRLQRTKPHADLKFVDRAGLAAARKSEQRQRVAGRRERVQIEAKARTIFVRSKEVNLEVEAQTEVQTNAEGQPIITGVVTIRRGTIEINGQRFDVDHARLMFDGEPGVNPALDIELQRQYDDYAAIIRVRGTLEKPDLQFVSSPPGLEPSQVIGLIMTNGQLGGDPSSSKFNPTSVIATAILGKLADQIAPQLGIDVLRVTSGDATTGEPHAGGLSELADTRVEVGKYLSPKIFLSFVHVFGATQNQNQNEARVEYRVTRRWVLETAFGDAGVGAIDFLWTWRY